MKFTCPFLTYTATLKNTFLKWNFSKENHRLAANNNLGYIGCAYLGLINRDLPELILVLLSLQNSVVVCDNAFSNALHWVSWDVRCFRIFAKVLTSFEKICRMKKIACLKRDTFNRIYKAKRFFAHRERHGSLQRTERFTNVLNCFREHSQFVDIVYPEYGQSRMRDLAGGVYTPLARILAP